MGYHFENKIPVIIAVSRAISWFYQGSNFSDISCCSLNLFCFVDYTPKNRRRKWIRLPSSKRKKEHITRTK